MSKKEYSARPPLKFIGCERDDVQVVVHWLTWKRKRPLRIEDRAGCFPALRRQPARQVEIVIEPILDGRFVCELAFRKLISECDRFEMLCKLASVHSSRTRGTLCLILATMLSVRS
jgi:hypothetical protein